ncbi:MAG: hypothetical protein LBD38_01735 [Streptococcaceae bacterium]|jgi:hypothetical protein|nr:hypothetical protein [Streptococcaceae bacterium]
MVRLKSVIAIEVVTALHVVAVEVVLFSLLLMKIQQQHLIFENRFQDIVDVGILRATELKKGREWKDGKVEVSWKTTAEGEEILWKVGTKSKKILLLSVEDSP